MKERERARERARERERAEWPHKREKLNNMGLADESELSVHLPNPWLLKQASSTWIRELREKKTT